jgi:hypothetical protein
MKQLNKEAVDNELGKYALTHFDIETQINRYSLEFIQVRNNQVEWQMKFPMFVPAFYKWIALHGTIPTQDEFWIFYQQYHREWFSSNPLNDVLLEGLKARAYRTYPSLVRDIHFAKFVQTELPYVEVIYDQRLDIEEGIDLLLIDKQKYHAINLYTDTARAYAGRQKKTFRHKDYVNVNYIELPVAFKGSQQSGQFFLYGDRELQLIKSAIQ